MTGGFEEGKMKLQRMIEITQERIISVPKWEKYQLEIFSKKTSRIPLQYRCNKQEKVG